VDLWLIVLLIFKLCDPMSTRLRVTVSPSSHRSESSYLAIGPGHDCDLSRGPVSPKQLVQKDFREQRAEYALGSKLAANVERHVELITDDLIVRYLNLLEQKIARSSGLAGCFVVKVLRDPEVNAYSLPGGFIYVTAGLIDLVEDEGELIAILAHETAHVTARHLTRIDSQARIWGRLALVGGPPGYVLRCYLGPLLTLKLLRNKEFEADRLGLQYEIASGYNPVEFWRILQLAFPEGEENESFLERLYDTHPSTNTRIERLQKATSLQLTPQTTYITYTSEFWQMKMRFAIIKTAQ
jgi:beta-barrel assembly-enhancing protease